MAKVWKREWINDKGEPCVAWRVSYYDANGKRGRQQFSSRSEADAFRVEIEGQIRRGTYRADAGKMAVSDAADQFLKHCQDRMKRRERMTRHNYKVYEGHIRNYICPDPQRHVHRAAPERLRPFKDGIGSVRLSQFTARVVGNFRDRLRDAGVSVATTRKILGTLKVMINYAVGQDLLAVNPAKDIKVIGRRDEGSKKIVPPSKEVMRLLIDVADEDFRLKLIFASSTGVRAGELHALRWHHISFDRAEVKIETRVDAYRDEDVTKTAAGMRTVPLSAALVRLLKEWRLRTKWSKAKDLVFPGRTGTFCGHDNMIKQKFLKLWVKLAEKHATDPLKFPAPPGQFNWHALRHFAISTWIDAGLAPKTVQTFAGHSSLAVTMDRYGHLFKSEDHRKAMERIASELLG